MTFRIFKIATQLGFLVAVILGSPTLRGREVDRAEANVLELFQQSNAGEPFATHTYSVSLTARTDSNISSNGALIMLPADSNKVIKTNSSFLDSFASLEAITPVYPSGTYRFSFENTFPPPSFKGSLDLDWSPSDIPSVPIPEIIDAPWENGKVRIQHNGTFRWKTWTNAPANSYVLLQLGGGYKTSGGGSELTYPTPGRFLEPGVDYNGSISYLLQTGDSSTNIQGSPYFDFASFTSLGGRKTFFICHTTTEPGTLFDNFNDGVPNPTVWSDPQTTNSGRLSEITGKMVYTTASQPTATDFASSSWLPYTENLSADWQAHVGVGTFPRGNTNTYYIGLRVTDGSNPGNFLDVTEVVRLSGASLGQFLESKFHTNNVLANSNSISLFWQTATLRIRYHAAAHALIADYPLGNAPNTIISTNFLAGWNVTPATTCRLSIIGGSDGIVLGANDAYVDYFVATDPSALPPRLGVIQTDSALKLSLQSIPGFEYQLETTPDFQTWSPFGPSQSAAANTQFMAITNLLGNAFFRLRKTPSQ